MSLIIKLSLHAQQVDGFGSSSVFSSLSEGKELIEDTNSEGNVLGSKAEVLSVSELKSEVVGGGHEVTNPSTGSEDTIPGVVDGLTEGLWEDSGVSLLEEGETEKGDVVDLEGELDVTVHGAFEIFKVSN